MTKNNYSYGRLQNGYFSKVCDFTLHSTGVVLSPASHPNDTYWKMKTDREIFIKDERQNLSTHFIRGARDIYTGSYEGNPGVIHYLYENNNTKRKYRLLVATHKNYLAPTNVMQSVEDAGFGKDDVTFVISGSEEHTVTENKIYTPLNFWEYGALHAVAGMDASDAPEYWFLIHDTCLLGPNFKARLDNYDISQPFDVISLNDANQFNIGFYRHEFLNKEFDYFDSIKNITKEEGIDIETNARIRDRSNFTSCFNSDFIGANKAVKVWGEKPRLEFYLSAIDVYKYLVYIGHNGHFTGPHPNTP